MVSASKLVQSINKKLPQTMIYLFQSVKKGLMESIANLSFYIEITLSHGHFRFFLTNENVGPSTEEK